MPACQIDAIITRKVRSHHRPIKSDEVRFVVQPAMKRRVIAIANKNFWVGANHRRIKMREQLSRTPSSAGADNPIDRRVRESGVQIMQSVFNRTRIVERSAIERVYA